LDAAAGSGALSRKLKNMGFEVVAADLNPDIFKPAEVKFQKVDLNNDLSFPDEFFDYIICVEGIEHLENPFHLLREFNRILRKGGKLILTTPNILNIHYRLRYLFLGYSDWLCGRILRQTPSDMYQFLQQHINPVDFVKLKYIFKQNKFSIEGIFINRSVLPYSNGLYFRPLVNFFLFLSTILVRLTVKLFKPNDPVVKELISDEILLGETLILKVRKE
jgi:ubiquinone/menaquinone biosynthesis C-methylase UbiE